MKFLRQIVSLVSVFLVFSWSTAAVAASINDVQVYDGSNYVPMGLAPWIKMSCIANPTSCSATFNYVSPTWYGAVCDGSTDDTIAIKNAVLASNNKVLAFPTGVTCITQYMDICSNSTCQTGHSGTGGSVPFAVNGNGATLKVPSSATGANTFVYVEQQTITNHPNFAMRDLIINGGDYVKRGFAVVGCVYCAFENISESHAQINGCQFSGMIGYVLANSKFDRLECNTNNTNDGVHGFGIVENTTCSWLGITSCAPGVTACPSNVSQNAGNTFISTHTLFNGAIGWLVDCANNDHVSPDSEQNLSYGLYFTSASAVGQWIGAQFSSNKNARGAAGAGGDASIYSEGTPGIQFFGGASDGTIANIDATHGDTLAMHGVAGFGYVANCGGSGHYCMTLP